MPYVSDIRRFIQSQESWPNRCLLLQREGETGGVYGYFTSDITAGAVPDAAVIKSLFDEGYKSLGESGHLDWTMTTLPLSHFVGLYRVTLLVQRHNSVVDVYDGLSTPVDAYMGVER